MIKDELNNAIYEKPNTRVAAISVHLESKLNVGSSLLPGKDWQALPTQQVSNHLDLPPRRSTRHRTSPLLIVSPPLPCLRQHGRAALGEGRRVRLHLRPCARGLPHASSSTRRPPPRPFSPQRIVISLRGWRRRLVFHVARGRRRHLVPVLAPAPLTALHGVSTRPALAPRTPCCTSPAPAPRTACCTRPAPEPHTANAVSGTSA